MFLVMKCSDFVGGSFCFVVSSYCVLFFAFENDRFEIRGA
jgi:hypothetical protein